MFQSLKTKMEAKNDEIEDESHFQWDEFQVPATNCWGV